MIDINRFYNSILDFLNKNNGQHVSPDEAIDAVRLASLDYFKEIKGGKLNNANVYGRNRILDARLNPFRATVPISFVAGVGSKPEGLELIRELFVQFNGKPKRVRQVEEHRWADTFDNPLADGIDEDPIFCEDEKTISINPSTITGATMKILRQPKDPKWAYTLTGRRPVYDPANSVDLEWDATEEAQLMMRTLSYLGLQVKDMTVIQFSEKEKQQN